MRSECLFFKWPGQRCSSRQPELTEVLVSGSRVTRCIDIWNTVGQAEIFLEGMEGGGRDGGRKTEGGREEVGEEGGGREAQW